MAEEGEHIRRLSRERLLAGEPVENIAEEDETCMERENNEEPEDAAQLSLLERFCVRFGNSRSCRYAPLLLVIPCVLIVLGLYAITHQIYMEYGSVAFVVGGTTLFMGIYLWRYRARMNSSYDPVPFDPSFPYYVQTLTTRRARSRSGQAPASNVGKASSSSPTHLKDPDVPSPSGLPPPVLRASGEHSSPHLELDKRTSGSEAPNSERQSVLQASVSRDSSAASTLSEVASSITQIAAGSVGKGEEKVPAQKATTRK